MLKQEKTESAHLASTSKDANKKRNKNKEAASGQTLKKQRKAQDHCYFCKTSGHMKKDCIKYHAWHAKKGTLFALVILEVNLACVPRNTLWIDFGATTHISVSMQVCLSF